MEKKRSQSSQSKAQNENTETTDTDDTKASEENSTNEDHKNQNYNSYNTNNDNNSNNGNDFFYSQPGGGAISYDFVIPGDSGNNNLFFSLDEGPRDDLSSSFLVDGASDLSDLPDLIYCGDSGPTHFMLQQDEIEYSLGTTGYEKVDYNFTDEHGGSKVHYDLYSPPSKPLSYSFEQADPSHEKNYGIKLQNEPSIYNFEQTLPVMNESHYYYGFSNITHNSSTSTHASLSNGGKQEHSVGEKSTPNYGMTKNTPEGDDGFGLFGDHKREERDVAFGLLEDHNNEEDLKAKKGGRNTSNNSNKHNSSDKDNKNHNSKGHKAIDQSKMPCGLTERQQKRWLKWESRKEKRRQWKREQKRLKDRLSKN